MTDRQFEHESVSYSPWAEKKLFVSTIYNLAEMPPRGNAIIATLERCEFELEIPEKWFPGYAFCERRIDASDAMITLADRNYYTAHLMATNITYALNGDGSNQIIDNHIPVPVFIFYLDEPFRIGYLQWESLRDHSYLHYLSEDVPSAVKEICSYFAQRAESA